MENKTYKRKLESNVSRMSEFVNERVRESAAQAPLADQRIDELAHSINLLQLKLETRKLRKSVRGMPRLSEAKKDVTSCEKLRGGANIR